MDILSLVYVLIGSVLHVAWNIFAKDSKDKLGFLWLALFPFALWGLWVFLQGADAQVFSQLGLYCVLASGLVHAFYFWSLSEVYHHADLSFVYPYSRGIGTLISVIGGVVFLHDSPSLTGSAGITLTLLGVFTEPLAALRRPKAFSKRNVNLTVATGLAIGSYLLIDKIGVREVRPLLYLPLFSFVICLFLIPVLALTSKAKVHQRLLAELKLSKFKVFWSGIFLYASYATILIAMSRTPLSYVTSARTSGIIISTLAGILFFKEKVSRNRWVSVVMISIGVYLIGIS